MPFRTGNTYTTPGGGTVTRGKSGKAKTYTGKGPAPAGTKKVAEKSYAEVPTVTVSSTPSGTRAVPSGFASEQAARRAVRAQKASARRVRRIVRAVTAKPQKASRKIPPPAKYTPPRVTPGMEKQAAAKISSAPTSKPKAFQGKPTVGTPTLKELRIAKQENALKVNKRGYLTTPSTRFAAKELKHAKKAVGHSKPDLSGLSPQERRAAKLDVKIGPKYGIPPSVLMAQQRQESGFDPAAVSSAGAQGISQFIPSTAASYGVRYGTGQPEVRSQIRGQAELLKDQGFKSNPQAALSAYSGGYAASDYNNPILEGSSDYKALDSRDNPKAIKRLADAKTLARSLGLRAAGKAVKPPKKLITRFKAAKKAMKEVEGLPYVWGGGHGSPTSSPTGGGLDCSGAVGYVLNKIGALHGSLTSGSMGSVLKPGPGALTVFYNAGHTFLRLGNEYWGTSVGDSGSGGLGPHPTPSASYLAQYNVGHVPGMGMKQALELGFKNLGTPSSFPGMTLSPSGTTATIDPGAGATQGKPGFSSSPIQPTQQQKARRAIKKLSQLGVPTSPKAKEATKGVTLAELEKTYGPSAV